MSKLCKTFLAFARQQLKCVECKPDFRLGGVVGSYIGVLCAEYEQLSVDSTVLNTLSTMLLVYFALQVSVSCAVLT